MDSEDSWDFREGQELIVSNEYNNEGYVIEKADFRYLELIKKDIEKEYFEFSGINSEKHKGLENAHLSISKEDSNDLRLHIMQKTSQSTNSTSLSTSAQPKGSFQYCWTSRRHRSRSSEECHDPNNP